MAGKRITIILSHLRGSSSHERDEDATATLCSSSLLPRHQQQQQQLPRRTTPAPQYLRQKQDREEAPEKRSCFWGRNDSTEVQILGGHNTPEPQASLQSIHKTNSRQILGDACSENFLTGENSTSKACCGYVKSQDRGVISTLICSKRSNPLGSDGKDSRSVRHDAENKITDAYSSEIGRLKSQKVKDAKLTGNLTTNCSDLECAIKICDNMLCDCDSHQHRGRRNVTISGDDMPSENHVVLSKENMASTSHSRTACDEISALKGCNQNSQKSHPRVDEGSKESPKRILFGAFSSWSFQPVHSHFARSKSDDSLSSENRCKPLSTLPFSQDCVFCDIVQGRTSAFKLYEDDHCICILDINPLCYGHSLIIPKAHFPSLEATPPQVAAAMCAVVPLISRVLMDATQSDAFNVVVNNGIAAGQVVFHTHFHIVPRFSGDGLWTAKSVERKTLKSFPDPAELVELVRSKLPSVKSRENF